MTTWTNFASLGVGPGTTPQLDANFSILSPLINIPCTVSGTNALTLTSNANASTMVAYQNYMNLDGVAAATNSGSVTANLNGFGAVNVYKDTPQGPQLLTGGEIIQNCQFALIYDQALNSNAGGFHLTGGGAPLAGQSITVQSLNASVGSIASLTANSFSLGSLQIGASVINAMTRLYSTLASVSFGIVLPQAAAQATVSFAGCQVLDNVIVGLPAAPVANVLYQGYVSGAGSIVMRAFNNASGSTVTLSLATFRLTNMGFVA